MKNLWILTLNLTAGVVAFMSMIKLAMSACSL